jgi:hypothetical protein
MEQAAELVLPIPEELVPGVQVKVGLEERDFTEMVEIHITIQLPVDNRHPIFREVTEIRLEALAVGEEVVAVSMVPEVEVAATMVEMVPAQEQEEVVEVPTFLQTFFPLREPMGLMSGTASLS